MNSKPLPRPINSVEVGVYECEIHLKFRLVEEKSDFIQTLQTAVKAHEVSEFKASPQMRRQLMRLRNSTETNQ